MNETKIPFSDDSIVTIIREDNVNYIIIRSPEKITFVKNKYQISKKTSHSKIISAPNIIRSTRLIISVDNNDDDNDRIKGKLEDIFTELGNDLNKYGKVSDYEINDGVGYVEYESVLDAQKVIKEIDKKVYKNKSGNKIKIFLDYFQ